jgi:hypothetical protein
MSHIVFYKINTSILAYTPTDTSIVAVSAIFFKLIDPFFTQSSFDDHQNLTIPNIHCHDTSLSGNVRPFRHFFNSMVLSIPNVIHPASKWWQLFVGRLIQYCWMSRNLGCAWFLVLEWECYSFCHHNLLVTLSTDQLICLAPQNDAFVTLLHPPGTVRTLLIFMSVMMLATFHQRFISHVQQPAKNEYTCQWALKGYCSN